MLLINVATELSGVALPAVGWNTFLDSLERAVVARHDVLSGLTHNVIQIVAFCAQKCR